MTSSLCFSVDQPKAVAIIRELDGLIVARLFGQGPWLCDPETALALHKKLLEWEVTRELPDSAFTNTDLGEQLNVDLHQVFMGLWCEGEVPLLLEEYGLIDGDTRDQLYQALGHGADPTDLLRPVVQQAYWDYGCRSARVC